MKNQFHKRTTPINLTFWLAGLLAVMLGLALAAAAQPALASAPAQQGYPAGTGTATATMTSTAGTGTVTVTPTVTQTGTLQAPARSGTPTALFPITGADLTQQGGESNVGTWVAIWLVGLLLIGFGLMSRMSKRAR